MTKTITVTGEVQQEYRPAGYNGEDYNKTVMLVRAYEHDRKLIELMINDGVRGWMRINLSREDIPNLIVTLEEACHPVNVAGESY